MRGARLDKKNSRQKGAPRDALDTMSKDTKGIKKYVEDIEGTMVKNILYFFEPQGVSWATRKAVGGCWKGFKKSFWGNTGHQKTHKKWERC